MQQNFIANKYSKVMQQYENHVKPAYDNYIAPTMQHADIIVPRGGENEVLLVQHIQSFWISLNSPKLGGDQPDCATCADTAHKQRLQTPFQTCRGMIFNYLQTISKAR